MDYSKWEWENQVFFNLKTVEEREGIIIAGKNSGSELAPGSSSRSSISVCTDSSFKEVVKNKKVAFSGDFREKEESPVGLKLGKRMYFESNGMEGNVKNVSLPTVKKIKLSNNIKEVCRCQVEGCNIDLSSAKEYHKKHKVCPTHSKSPKVVVAGQERRFCQQCSRFHSLSEFDGYKRSCRKRLTDHNTRRRKPQLDPILFNTMRLPSPFSAFTCADEKQQMSCVSNKGVMLNFGKTEGINEQMQSTRTLSLPHHNNISKKLLPYKPTKFETFPRASSCFLGAKEHVLPPNLDPAPDFHRALSLLSNGSYQPSNNSLDHSINVDNNNIHQLLNQNFPQNTSEFCQTDHNHTTDDLIVTANDTSRFQLFKSPYEDVLYSNPF